MITLEQYIGPYRTSTDWTVERQLNAQKLLSAAFLLSGFMEDDGIKFPINPATKSQVSGRGNGGFRHRRALSVLQKATTNRVMP